MNTGRTKKKQKIQTLKDFVTPQSSLLSRTKTCSTSRNYTRPLETISGRALTRMSKKGSPMNSARQH